jgi:anti-sigma factor RsiW
MNINRHNYEEYFLLYVDGELSSADRAQVEAFARQHPDLADELEMLREAVLHGDSSPEMPGKEALIKLAPWNADHLTPQQQQLLDHAHGELPEAEARNLHSALEEDALLRKEWELLQQTALPHTLLPMPNRQRLLHTTLWNEDGLTPLQQDLLMLAEGELPAHRKAAVEAALAQDEMLRKELHLLQAARLEPETIVMPGKERLLRRQKAPVVPMLWVRRLAAAAVITGVGWLMWSQLDNTGTTPGKNGTEVVKASQPASTGISSQQPGQQATDKRNAEQTASTNNTAADAPQLAKAVAARSEASGTQPIPGATQQVLIAAEEQPSYTTDRAMLAASRTIEPASIEAVNTMPAANNGPLVAGGQPQMIAQQAAFDEDDYFNAEDERINIGGLPIRKEKLRGIYRTVTRTLAQPFEKRNLANADNSGQPMK